MYFRLTNDDEGLWEIPLLPRHVPLTYICVFIMATCPLERLVENSIISSLTKCSILGLLPTFFQRAQRCSAVFCLTNHSIESCCDWPFFICNKTFLKKCQVIFRVSFSGMALLRWAAASPDTPRQGHICFGLVGSFELQLVGDSVLLCVAWVWRLMGAGSAVKFDDGCWGVTFPGRSAFSPGWTAAAAAAAWSLYGGGSLSASWPQQRLDFVTVRGQNLSERSSCVTAVRLTGPSWGVRHFWKLPRQFSDSYPTSASKPSSINHERCVDASLAWACSFFSFFFFQSRHDRVGFYDLSPSDNILVHVWSSWQHYQMGETKGEKHL